MSIESLVSEEENEPLLRPVMPELDTIRGLAILMVVVYHGFYWQVNQTGLPDIVRLLLTATWTGRFGVNLFFVLSGFLITGILLDSSERPDYYRHFYLRRALRILPAYYGILLILLLTRYCPYPFLILSAVYLANLAQLFGVMQGYPVLWSLAVEEQYYLVWPAIVKKLEPMQLLGVSIAVIALTPVSRVISLYVMARHGYVSYWFNNFTWNSLDGLACGAALALAIRIFRWNRRTLLRISATVLVAAFALWWLAIPFGILAREGNYLGAALQVTPINIGFTGLLALFLLVGTSRWKSFVLGRPLRYLGYISYGLYLFHLLVFNGYDYLMQELAPKLVEATGKLPALCIRFLVVSAVAVGLAHLSRKYFEEAFLRLKNRGRTES